LQDLRAALQTTQEGIPQWQAEMRRSLEKLGDRLTEETQQLRQRLQALSASVEEALQRLALLGPHLADDLANSIPWAKEALAYLDRRRAQGIPGECPLPELFAALAPRFQDLSVTSFQEGLRRLNDRRALTLVPWSSSAKEMGQPEFALFDNGNLYYFVALKGVTVPSA
jgi:hypothetical protein